MKKLHSILSNSHTIRVLHALNFTAVLWFVSEFTGDSKFYGGAVFGVLMVYYALNFFITNKWLEISYYVVYSLFFGLCLLTIPMGVVFALTGGLMLTFQVLLGYLVVAVFLAWNAYHIFRIKKM